MAKYVTRTIGNYNTLCTFVMDKQLNEHIFLGEIGTKKAKKELVETFGTNDIVVVSCEKQLESSKLYRMLESDFIDHAEVVEDSSSEE